MEKYTMVKTEVQENGDIYLFYVDENDDQESVVTIDQSQLQQLTENYVIEQVPADQHDDSTTTESAFIENLNPNEEMWSDDETRKLLIFYADNKEAFQNNDATKKHLWSVACKTMLTEKDVNSCELKLQNLKDVYAVFSADILKRNIWPYFDLCHKAFHDDSLVSSEHIVNINHPGGVVTLKRQPPKPYDEKLMQMLNIYLKGKQEIQNDSTFHKIIWERITLQLGEDSDYWHKRFLNFKQHYIRLIDKRARQGPEGISWPYMEIFNEIYKNDNNFKRKYMVQPVNNITNNISTQQPSEWNDTERTVLVKYCFDCFDEFQDPTIPDTFLWNEVGRLLDKSGDSCKNKYEELKSDHLISYLKGGYDMRTRKPLAILFDNIISKELRIKFQNLLKDRDNLMVEKMWETDIFDTLVQFFSENLELFKDPVCHFVCWAAVARKMECEEVLCRQQWYQLTTLYKSILNEKKEDSDLQIEWRYIEIFDQIFDYGTDTQLLEGYEQLETSSSKTGKKQNKSENSSDANSETSKDPKSIQILEYYLKNKDKFSTTLRKKQALWETLGKQIGISGDQCAQRFKELRRLYTSYIQSELNKPDKPVLWPYYSLCKKVFGYRAIKNKLKTKIDNDNMVTDKIDGWSPKEVKALINYASQNLEAIELEPAVLDNWHDLSKELGKSATSCKNKFLDLRKSYRKVKTMKANNAECKVNWKYFKLFDQLYSIDATMDVDQVESIILPSNAIKQELQGDDDYHCIIVIPETEEVPEIKGTQMLINNVGTPAPAEKNQNYRKVWLKKDKTNLLTHYYDYLKANEGNVIEIKTMWKEIASKFEGRTFRSCRNMYLNLKKTYKELLKDKNDKMLNKTPYSLMDKVLKLKPKFVKSPFTAEDVVLKEESAYKDLSLPFWKVEKALNYYLEHIEEFVDPKYDAKYAWIDLAKHAEMPTSKVFRKINYLKQNFDSGTNEVNGVKIEFSAILKEILEKEFLCKVVAGNLPAPSVSEEAEVTWSDEETELLLLWYLTNLDKFKNPKYISSYLWLEASQALNKNATACSKKMMDIRSQYSTMVKENSDKLTEWKFYNLCQKIYGTGKRSPTNVDWQKNY